MIDVVVGPRAVLGKQSECDMVCQALPSPDYDSLTAAIMKLPPGEAGGAASTDAGSSIPSSAALARTQGRLSRRSAEGRRAAAAAVQREAVAAGAVPDNPTEPAVYHVLDGGMVEPLFPGALAALAWPAMLACAAIWGLTLFLSRISSVSSLVSVIAAPVFDHHQRQVMVLSLQIGRALTDPEITKRARELVAAAATLTAQLGGSQPG